jgi:transcriptional regulator with XRE-family HTH domain
MRANSVQNYSQQPVFSLDGIFRIVIAVSDDRLVCRILQFQDQIVHIDTLRYDLKMLGLIIRLALGLSQDGMLESLGLAESSFRSAISGYERGEREPPLPVLLKYARCVGISTDVLIDDELDLPERLSNAHKQDKIKRKRKITMRMMRKQ